MKKLFTIMGPDGKFTKLEIDVDNPFLGYESNTETGLPISSQQRFSISVRRETGNTISLFALSSQPISSLIHLIHSKEGIPVHEQCLYLAGMRLLRYRPLSHYNICEGRILDLFVTYRGKLKIYVLSGSDEKIPLDVDSTMLVREVKALIHLRKGIPVEQQKLVYFGEQLEDDWPLFHYHIRKESPLLLVVDGAGLLDDMPIQIYVNIAATGKTINLQANISDTIHDVKAKIQAEEDIPLNKQLLFLPRLRLDNNTSALAECFIRDGSTLHLVQTTGPGPGQKSDPTTTDASIRSWNSKSPLLLVDSTDDQSLIGRDNLPIQIYVNIATTGKTINLQVKNSDTIHDVKSKIQAEEDIPLNEQLLFYHRLQLDNNTSALGECFIRDGSTLHLVQTTGPGQKSDPTTTDASLLGWIARKRKYHPVGRSNVMGQLCDRCSLETA